MKKAKQNHPDHKVVAKKYDLELLRKRKRLWHLKQERRRSKTRAVRAAEMCQRCPKPGSCCRRIVLWTRGRPFPATDDLEEAQEKLDSHSECYPFEIHGYGTTPGGEPMWILRCKMLTPEGRCGIYAYRPELCRTFQPGGDLLCIQTPDPKANRGILLACMTKVIAEEDNTGQP